MMSLADVSEVSTSQEVISRTTENHLITFFSWVEKPLQFGSYISKKLSSFGRTLNKAISFPPGAMTQTVSTNNSIWPNLIFYIDKTNYFSKKLSDIFNHSNIYFSDMFDFLGQPTSLNVEWSSLTNKNYLSGINPSLFSIGLRSDNIGLLGVSLGDHYLIPLDLTNSTSPSMVGYWLDIGSGGAPISIKFKDKIAFVTTILSSNCKFLIINTTDINPSSYNNAPVIPKMSILFEDDFTSSVFDTTWDQNVLVVVASRGIKIFNITSFPSTIFMANWSMPNINLRNGVIQNDVLWLSDFNLGLHALNISNPQSPTWINTFTYPCLQVYVQGDLFFLFDTRHPHLRVLNFSNITSPMSISTYNSSLVSGDYLFMTSAFYEDLFFMGGDGVLEVVNISDPKSLQYRAFFNVKNSVIEKILVKNNTIFIADHAQGFNIIDFSSFSFIFKPQLSDRGVYPLIVSSLIDGHPVSSNFLATVSELPAVKNNLPSDAISLSQGNQLFSKRIYLSELFDYQGGIGFLDINLTNQTKVPSFFSWSLPVVNAYYYPQDITNSYETSSYGMVVRGNIVFLLIENALKVLDISQSNTVLIKNFVHNIPASFYIPNKVSDYSEDILLILGGDNYIGVVNITDVKNPVLQSLVSIPGFTASTPIYQEKLAFIPLHGLASPSISGLAVFNMTNVSAITEVTFYNVETSGSPGQAALINNYVFFGVDFGFDVINIKNISNITTVFSYRNLDLLYPDVISRGNYLYVGSSKLYVFDVTFPEKPILENNETVLSASIGNSKYFSNLLMVADLYNGLQIFDISNPKKPSLLSVVNVPGEAVFDFDLVGSRLLMSAFGNGLQILDFSQAFYTLSVMPLPVIAGNYDFSISFKNDLGVAADRASFYTLRIEGAPVLVKNVSTQNAFVGQYFNFALEEGVFFDPNGDLLQFTTTGLPAWMGSTLGGVLFGTPAIQDIGLVNVSMIANDGHAGTAAVYFTIRISFLPIVQNSISDCLVNLNVPFRFTIPKGSVVLPDQGSLLWSASLGNGLALPSNIEFNSGLQLFTGLLSTRGSINIAVKISTIYGGSINTYFNFICESFPYIQKSLKTGIIPIGSFFSYSIPPDLCADADDLSLSYFVNGLPSEFNFDPKDLLISGTVGSNLFNKTVNINLICQDSFGAQDKTNTSFVFSYFPVKNQAYTWDRFVVPLYQEWVQTLPNDLFLNQETGDLVFSVSWSSALNSIYYSNQTLYAYFNDTAITPITISAQNTKGAISNFTMTLIGASFPKISLSANPIIVAINQLFSYALPDNFVSGGVSPFSLAVYQVFQVKSRLKALANAEQLKPLTNVFSFNDAKRTFSANPTNLDEGNITVRLFVTDSIGASVSSDLIFWITYIPTVIKTFGTLDSTEGIPLTYNFSQNFENRSGRKTYFSLASVNNQTSWLKLDTEKMLLFGVPPVSGFFNFDILATDGVGSNQANFAILTANNLPPVFPLLLQDQTVYVVKDFSFSFQKPVDPEGQNISLKATWGDESPLTHWINFNASQCLFFGKPRRSDTNLWGHPKEYQVKIFANDGFSVSTATFKLIVGGDSELFHIWRTLRILIGVFTPLLTLYGFRAPIAWFFKKNKQAYTVVVGQEIKQDNKVGYLLGSRTDVCYVSVVKFNFFLFDLSTNHKISEFFGGGLRTELDGKHLKLLGKVDQVYHSEQLIVYNRWGLYRLKLQLSFLQRNSENILENNIEINPETIEAVQNPLPELLPLGQEKDLNVVLAVSIDSVDVPDATQQNLPPLELHRPKESEFSETSARDQFEDLHSNEGREDDILVASSIDNINHLEVKQAHQKRVSTSSLTNLFNVTEPSTLSNNNTSIPIAPQDVLIRTPMEPFEPQRNGEPPHLKLM